MKKKVLIIFGGKSGEHEVSVNSAKSIEKNIDHLKYSTLAMSISHLGQFNTALNISQLIDGQKVIASNSKLSLPSNTASKELSLQSSSTMSTFKVDIVFPVIHGTNGEDGTLQGLLELINLPYVGCPVLGSALTMDKVVQKQLCQLHQIPQVNYLFFLKFEFNQAPQKIIEKIIKYFDYPIFVKPANLGSSVGISKVKNKHQLTTALDEAFKYDNKVIVEQGLTNIKEIEVAVLGNDRPQASVCGEIITNTEFYDYQTKYITNDIQTKIPADISPAIANQIRKTALKAFQITNCAGLARVDFLFEPQTNQYYLNELNSMPGFTTISMYPKLWQASGLSYQNLITKLLNLAQEKWQAKQSLITSYQP